MSNIKEHCCGADLFFNKKTAAKEYKNYLKKGPLKATAKIIEQLKKQDVIGKSLIDVGGGIGALQWWFLKTGGKKTIDIDASSGYLKQAEIHAAKNGWKHQTQFFMGDCTEVYDRVEAVDFITLDKVVCCYPNYKEILNATCNKSSGLVSLSYPMDGIIARVLKRLGDLFFILKGNAYRPYVHPVKEIRALFTKNGYKRVAHNLVFPWHVETYQRLAQ